MTAPASEALALWLALLCSGAAAGDLTPPQSAESFAAAIGNRSTSPSYIKITVIDGNTGFARVSCTMAPFLIGALMRENPRNFATPELAGNAALQARNHTFLFSNPAALQNIAFSFSESEFEAMRNRLAALTDAELAEGFSTNGNLHSVYKAPSNGDRRAARDAAACALIDRGFSPRVADITGALLLLP